MPELTASIQEIIRVNGLWLIPALPALGAAINLLFGSIIQRRMGKTPIHAVAVGSMLLSSLVAIFFFVKLLLIKDPAQRFLLDDVYTMIDIGAVRVNLAFAMDPLSGIMTTMVTVVATAIHIYSTGYMAAEKSYWRFLGYLNLFCFSMLMLVLGDNFIIMFFGWEGVGLCSYLLIGFWYNKSGTSKPGTANAKAGMKAFVVNRIGDFGFVVGMCALFWGLLGMWDAPITQRGPSLSSVASTQEIPDGRCVEVKATRMQLPGHGHGDHKVKRGRTSEQRGRCGKALAGYRAKFQDSVTPGARQLVYLGPTVSFRELKDQLSLQNSGGDRVVAKHLAGSKVEFKLFGWLAKPLEKVGLGKWAGYLGGGWIAFPLLILVTFGFFLGACGKSAQIPLYVWLPDAMAGPTPVSALIHAATMVTAGVYMVARLNFIFIMSPEGMTLVATVGALTALFAATIGLFQYDIKKVLAYSTVSQLGYMFVGVGVGAYWVGIYHLLAHAFFKACLFLGSGSVIHGMHYVEHHGDHGKGHKKYNLRLEPNPTDPQDMRNMGGLAKLMPTTRMTYLISCLAISGIPLFSGFYSKDEILWKAMSSGNLLIPGWTIWALCALGAMCTAFYMFRSYYMTFYGKPASEAHTKHVHESPRSMTWVLIFLAAGAVLMSLVGSMAFVPSALMQGEHAWHPWLAHFLAPSTDALSAAFHKPAAFTSHALEYGLMGLSVLLALAGIFGARFWYKDIAARQTRMTILREDFNWLHKLIHNKYFVDEIYNATVVAGFMGLTRALAWFDARAVDGMVNATGYALRGVSAVFGYVDYLMVDGMVNFVGDLVRWFGRLTPRLQTGRINTYVMGVTFGVVILLFITINQLLVAAVAALTAVVVVLWYLFGSPASAEASVRTGRREER